MKKVNIGLIGFGTIGAGVVKVLQSRRQYLREKTGLDLCIKRICDKDIETKRPVKVSRNVLTRSIGTVLYDPNINIIIELVGGVYPARDIVMEALRQGKHVVTANKAVLSECGHDIFNLANTLGLSVGFEASVGGGVPIIRSLRESFVSDKIEIIYGIINGTSNFMLSKMAEDGHNFKEVLREAQSRGYAERDPYLDISGGDSCHKLAILALVGFGVNAKPSDIYTEGIENIEPADISFAKELGYAIKSLAIAKRKGDSLELRVHPTLIPKTHLLAGVSGVYNAVFVKGDLIGEQLFYGEGAGARPTSSAVISDVVSIARHTARCPKSEKGMYVCRDAKMVEKMDDVRTRYYIRFSAVDKPGVLAKVSGILGKHRISIASVTQKARKAAKVVPIVMMTHEALESDMACAIREIDALAMIKSKTVRVRVEN